MSRRNGLCRTIPPRDTLSAGVAIPVTLEETLSFEGPQILRAAKACICTLWFSICPCILLPKPPGNSQQPSPAFASVFLGVGGITELTAKGAVLYHHVRTFSKSSSPISSNHTLLECDK